MCCTFSGPKTYLSLWASKERGKGDLSQSGPLFSAPKNIFFGLSSYLALLIQKFQDPQLGLNEINDRLVIAEVNHGVGDPFFRIFHLAQLEDVLEAAITEAERCV